MMTIHNLLNKAFYFHFFFIFVGIIEKTRCNQQRMNKFGYWQISSDNIGSNATRNTDVDRRHWQTLSNRRHRGYTIAKCDKCRFLNKYHRFMLKVFSGCLYFFFGFIFEQIKSKLGNRRA